MENNSINQTLEKLTKIAGNAALQVNGVGSLVNAPINFNMITREYSKGVSMAAVNNELIFDLYINIRIGGNIPEIAFKVQEHVKKTIEKVCNKQVSKVNIHVQGIDF